MNRRIYSGGLNDATNDCPVVVWMFRQVVFGLCIVDQIKLTHTTLQSASRVSDSIDIFVWIASMRLPEIKKNNMALE